MAFRTSNAREEVKLPKLERIPASSANSLNVKADKYFCVPKLKRIFYPPISTKNKENLRCLLVESCVQNKTYEDVEDENNERKIKSLLGPKAGRNEQLPDLTKSKSLIGKQATLQYYEEYKKLDKITQRKKLRADLQRESYPCSTILEREEEMQLLPCCLGLIKLKGEPSVLSVNNYNLGDKYVSALSAGFSDAKMLEKCLLSHNRITDKGLFQLMKQMNQEINEIDLSYNQITKTDKKLLLMISEPEYRLEKLNLQGNKVKSSSIIKICQSVIKTHYLKSLNLRKNGIMLVCLEEISQMLQNATSLEELYIGSNYLSSACGQVIFKVLERKKHLKVLDYSLNQLGADDVQHRCAKAISSCFASNKILQHVDISANSFTREGSTIIAEGLKGNKTIYGIHFAGNLGFVNSRGFLMVEQNQATSLHSMVRTEIKGFEVVSRRQKSGFESSVFKNVCWICQGWYQQQFKFAVPEQANVDNLLVYIHFEFEKYDARLISVGGKNVRYVTMVPPKYYRYFFSFNGTIFLDENPKSTPVKLPLPEEISYEVNKEVLLLKVEKASQRNGKAKKIANDWNQLLVKTLPRTNGLVAKKVPEPWTYKQSIWAKQWKLEEQELTKKCFEKDWKNSKISNLIKNQNDQDNVKSILSKHYLMIKRIYRHFSAWSPVGEVWAISSNPFTQFCQIAKIVNKETPLKIIDLTFITTNSMSGADWKGNFLVPERGLVRFQFMESLVRLSEEKFKKNGLVDTFAEGVQQMMKDHVKPMHENYNSDKWRLEKYFTEEVDTLLKKYRGIFSNIYKNNSKLKLKPGEKPFMCLTEFKSIFEKANLGSFVLQRDANISFNTSMMAQVDQLESERFMRMTEIQFIEAIARCADLLPSTCVVEKGASSQLSLKLEWIIHELKNHLCSQQIKLQFPNPNGKSLFSSQEDQ